MAAMPVAAQAPEDILDHFKVYDVFSWYGSVGEPVYLDDQFGHVDYAIVEEAVMFANPVDKNFEGILWEQNHLTMYDLSHDEPFVPRTVEVNNQFGPQELQVVSGPLMLAVPTAKNLGATPVDLDHFLLYEVTGEAIDVGVSLQDQWGPFPGPEFVLVMEPIYLGNPVQKTNWDGTVTPILHPDAHLVFYRIEGASSPYTFIFVFNQFVFDDLLEVYDSYFLAVPSEKSLPQVVGWETYSIGKVRVLLPWIALGAAIIVGASLLVLRRRRAQS
jgi:hypothetical protein